MICHTFLCNVKGDPKIDTTKNPADENFTEIRWMTMKALLNAKDIILSDSFTGMLKESNL